MSEKQITPDFIAHIGGEFATCWTIEAASEAAKEFARENFVDVPDWSGTPEHFTTDWRPARDLCAQLADEGFTVCCKQPGRHGYGVWAGRN